MSVIRKPAKDQYQRVAPISCQFDTYICGMERPASPVRDLPDESDARVFWCCERGLNSRPLPYQGSALPLSYRSWPNAGPSATACPQVQGVCGIVRFLSQTPCGGRISAVSGQHSQQAGSRGSAEWKVRGQSENRRANRIGPQGSPTNCAPISPAARLRPGRARRTANRHRLRKKIYRPRTTPQKNESSRVRDFLERCILA
jgi:hypothetical protein